MSSKPVAVVFGVGSNVGTAIVKRFVGAGYRVAVVSRSAAEPPVASSDGTTLPIRLRAIVVLRVAVKRQAAYVWAQHFFNGRDAGLTDEEIARLAYGPDAPFFAPLDAATIRAVDELIDDGVIGDATWAELAAELNEQQLFDLIFTVGCYETVSFLMRSIGLEVDPTIPDLLAGTDG